MNRLTPYDEAQALVAAVRVHEFTKKASPSFKEVAEILEMTTDWVSRVCSELTEKGIVDLVEGPFQTTCIVIEDHLAVESLPKKARENRMEEELKKFKEKTAGLYEQKVKAIQEEQKKKEQDLYNDIADKFKRELDS
ncbi:hypothetical protein SAMN05216233_11066 [Desulfoluna spongiiphila]|uniref:Uncharacterized protein n=2 Tax=Desulfoluna spongiiphila TaxID=419481 RepID=A0A1G5GBI9_9BACT|nr:hypothetical protein SAMN05216233_11066 [Desulfoluna spongiiphila]VVS93654.1 hypothetical protein DBB_32260 [Desulfoluna spongiiphila]